MATATKLVQVPHREAEARMFERHYSPADLGELWNLSADTVRRMFENEPGVLAFENSTRSSSRRFRTLRIPESVAQRVYSRFGNTGMHGRGRIRA
jgi:hypothetical protein